MTNLRLCGYTYTPKGGGAPVSCVADTSHRATKITYRFNVIGAKRRSVRHCPQHGGLFIREMAHKAGQVIKVQRIGH